MASEFDAGGQGVQLSVVSYLLGLMIGQLIYGPVSDHVGRKPPLYAGIVLYIAASIACSLVHNVTEFILLRFFQGLGGCAGMVIARAVVRDRTATAGAARAFSLLMLIVSVAPLLAPLLGAALLQHWGWRSMFLVMATFGLFCLVGVNLAMKETLSTENRKNFTWKIIIANYWHVFKDQDFITHTLCNGLAQGSMYAYIAGSSFVLMELYDISPQQYALIFAINSFGMIAASQINIFLISRFTVEKIMSFTLNVLGGVSVLALMVTGDPPIFLLLFSFFFSLSCIGLIAPNAAALALAGHAQHAGAASALMGTLIFVIGALCGVAVTMLHDGSMRPLVFIMAMCGITSALLHRFAGRQCF
ncbi:Sulfonamide resistance protein [Aeromonas hydrophila]|nr:Sulfonamide resistance protein [Aeromonas hydrophila]